MIPQSNYLLVLVMLLLSACSRNEVETNVNLAVIDDGSSTEQVEVKPKRTSALSRELRGKVHRMKDGMFVKEKLASAKYYLIYVSRRGWTSCYASASKFVEVYHRFIETNPDAELLFVSRGKDRELCRLWSVEKKFPWPQIIPGYLDENFSFMRHSEGLTPETYLVDSSGNLLERGLTKSLKRMKR